MNRPSVLKSTITLSGFILCLLLGPQSAALAEPAQIESGPLSDAVMMGAKLFVKETFGGNGKTCQTCHADGGKGGGTLPDGRTVPALNNAAAIFPRYNARQDKVFTLSDQMRHCINQVKGTPPAYGSVELNALVSYVSSLSEGQPIDMGGKPK